MAEAQIDKTKDQDAQQAPIEKKAPEVAKDGPGLTALKALVAKGPPDMKAVIAIVDKNRGEHDAMFAYMQQTLGNSFTQQLVAQMDKMRVSIDNKEIVAGDPSNPKGGYFAAGQPEQGAKWQTANGNHVGKIDKDGLDSTDKLNAHDSIHTKITKDKDATIDWNKDGKTEAEAFAHVDSKDSWSAGVKKDWSLGKDGKDTLDTKFTHTQTKTGSSDMLGADYKTADGKTTASGEAGVKDGKATVDGKITEKLKNDTIDGSFSADKDKQTATVSDDHKFANGNDLKASATATHDKDGTSIGANGEYKTKTDDVKAAVNLDPKKQTASISDEHKFANGNTANIGATLAHDKDGTTLGSTGEVKTKTDDAKAAVTVAPDKTSASISDDHKFKSGAELNAGLDYAKTKDGETTKLHGDYKNADGSTTASGSAGVEDGKFVADGKVMHKFGKDDVLNGSFSHDKKGITTGELGEKHTFANGGTFDSDLKLQNDPTKTPGQQWTGSLDGKYESKDKKTELDGSLGRTNDAWKLHLGGQSQLNPNLSLGGSADYTHPDAGKDQAAFSLKEQYKSSKMVQSLELGGGMGQKDYLSAKGSLDAQLAPKWYAGAWGGAQFESGKQTQANLGASVTFTPNEKSALTLAGIVDQHGTVETRLQYDVFKSKLDGVSGLADHKKDALVSLFVSYKTQAGPDMMDDRFGAPTQSASHGMGGGQVMGGIKISF